MSAATFQAGVQNLPCWQGLIDRHYTDDVDRLTGTYVTRRGAGLAKGDAVPGFPGMIIRELRQRDTGLSLRHEVSAEGSLNGTNAAKLINRSEVRSLGAQFETFSESWITWLAQPLSITGTASTDVITTSAAHGYVDGQRVVLLDVTGGLGLTAQSTSSLGTRYYVRDATSTTLKLAATAGGTALDFTTNITAGMIIAAEFCPGTAHATWPSMYLAAVQLQDAGTPWRRAELQYSGKLWSKGYQRNISVAGQQCSSSDAITISLPGGWSSPRYSTFVLPEVVVTDTVITATAPATGAIPAFATPADAPAIQSLVLSGPDLVYNYPYGWTLTDSSHVETLHKDIALHIQQNVYRYVWPVMFR